MKSTAHPNDQRPAKARAERTQEDPSLTIFAFIWPKTSPLLLLPRRTYCVCMKSTIPGELRPVIELSEEARSEISSSRATEEPPTIIRSSYEMDARWWQQNMRFIPVAVGVIAFACIFLAFYCAEMTDKTERKRKLQERLEQLDREEAEQQRRERQQKSDEQNPYTVHKRPGKGAKEVADDSESDY